jgi:hypothetical protein
MRKTDCADDLRKVVINFQLLPEIFCIPELEFFINFVTVVQYLCIGYDFIIFVDK